MEEDNKIKSAGNISILNDSQSLIQLLTSFESNAKFVVDKIWANVKFFTAISSALLTTSIAFYGSESVQNIFGLNPNLKSLVFAVIPIIVIMISGIGMKNLKREYRRFLEWVSVIQKIQEMLGLHDELRTNIFSADKYLLPDHFLSKDYSNSKEFIDSRLNKKGTLFHYFKFLHWSYITIAVTIALLILLSPLQFFINEIIRICS